MTLCAYSTLFGAPAHGIHSLRIFNTPIADYGLSILLAFSITWKTKMPLELSTILVLVVGIIFHYMFCVQTNTMKYISSL